MLTCMWLMTACAAIPVGSDRYDSADFSPYRTYGWINEEPMIHPASVGQQVSALTSRRIREAIEAELSAKGYRKADGTAQADFVLAFSVGTQDRLDAESYPVPYNGPWQWERRQDAVEVHTYREGTLSIDVFDGASKQPIWHGWATKVITNTDMANPGPVIQNAVARILRVFPPSHD
jgi:hypothetical protein